MSVSVALLVAAQCLVGRGLSPALETLGYPDLAPAAE